MNEVFIIEQMVALGYWELMSKTFFTDEKVAIDKCLEVMTFRQKTDKNFCARVTKLEIAK